MAVRPFKEKEVRKAILNKTDHLEKSGPRGGHLRIWLLYNEMKFDHLTVPNNHNNEFLSSKGNGVAEKLRLTHDQYNLFMECKMKKQEYLDILDALFK
jgi:hypothetical protein